MDIYMLRWKRLVFVVLALFLLFTFLGSKLSNGVSSSSENIDLVGSTCKQIWHAEVEESNDGIYDLSLCFTVTNDVGANVEEPTIDARSIKHNVVRNRKLNFNQLSKIPDNAWKPQFSRDVYHLFPQALPMDKLIDQIKNGLPIPEHPINNPPIQFLTVPSNVCPPKGAIPPRKLDVLVLFKSGVYNLESREQIRRDYKNYILASSTTSPIPDFEVGIVFSIGIPRKSGKNQFQRDGFTVFLGDRAGEALLEHSKNYSILASRLNKEITNNNDLLIGNYEDTYFNLTLKLMHSMRWAVQFCRPFRPTIVILDDDYRVNISMLHEVLSNVNEQDRGRLLKGVTRDGNVVIRPSKTYLSKWALSKTEVPWPYHPPDALGIFTIIGYDLLENATVAMFFTKHIHIDDSWLSYVIYKLGVKFSPSIGSYFDVPLEAHCENVLSAPINYFERCHWFTPTNDDLS